MAATRILLVEDSFDDMQVICATLEYYGVEVVALQNGDDCGAALREMMPDAVITDLAMPGANGWDVLAMVRENPHTAHLPVMAVTSYDSPRLADEALRGGFDSYLPKPIDPVALFEQLNRLLTR